jgi:CheY-like chemotaxis protein
MIRFEVIDTGCGIEDKVLSNLLTNSEIKETEVPDSSHLSGLGLTTVKMILKELGSELCIKSKQSEGSSFAFVLNYLHPMERKFTIVQDSPKKLRQNGSIDSIADDFFQTYNDENYKTDLLETLTDDFLFPPMRHPGILVFNSMEQIDQIPEEYNSAKAPDYMEVEPSNRSKSQRKQTSVIWEICVVDDNKMNRIVLCNYMKAFTMNSKEFINGKEIYDYMVTMLKTHNNALFSNQSIERKYLIFMDVNMPIMDGIESTRKIYELEGAHNCVAVIAVTAFTENSTRDDCIEVGMAKVLNKPVARSEFIEVMKLLVDESE